MKKRFLIILSFYFIFDLTKAYRVTFDNLTFVVSSLNPFEDDSVSHKDVPDKCFHRETEHIWSPGEQWGPPGKCWIARCSKPGVAIVHHCGIVSPETDNYSNKYCVNIGMDINRPYPGCCNRFLCRGKHGRPYIYNPLIIGGGRENAYPKL